MRESFFTPKQEAVSDEMLKGTELENAGLARLVEEPKAIDKVFEFRSKNYPSHEDGKGRTIVGDEEAERAARWLRERG